jgi:formamidopyrimidine-DNA glycosylase
VSENLLFGDGVVLTYHPDRSKIPKRIPGLGNDVLQDILWKAKLHPRRKVNSLNEEEKDALFSSIKRTLRMMTEQGGRDTEKDLFGNKGGVMRL